MGLDRQRANPYDWTNPVGDPNLFAGRRLEIKTIWEEISQLKAVKSTTPMVALVGERRVGKTSLLLRIQEQCEREKLITCRINITGMTCKDSWEFWNEIFVSLFSQLNKMGIILGSKDKDNIGFQNNKNGSELDNEEPIYIQSQFISEYYLPKTERSSQVHVQILENDLNILIGALKSKGYIGIVLILDEAHKLIDSRQIMEQIRFATQGVTGIGVLFSGELQLSSLFSDPKEPLYAQAKVVLMQNLTDLNDIAECSLLPISSEERILMSPITIEYLFRLSQGKPNQIRLICKAIYSRYSAGLQNDLNITVDVLDNVVELLSQSFQEQSMQVKINAIHNLNSIDLEMLYDMTRYPNWSVKEVVDLDESFRGDTKSELAANRRERKLLEKREYFASIGLMHTGDKKFILVGGEFVSLYLRLWYEIRKYGKLSRKLILGKGPPTPFGEKVEKFISSLAYLVGEAPELNQFVFHESANEEGRIVESVKHRFETIKSLTQRQIPEGDKWNNEFAEMLSLSELVAKNGQYHLLCLSLRNLNNPRELMQVELYFAENPDRTINLDGLIKLLNQQALDARIMIGEWDWFQVKLFDLPSLLEAIGAPSLSEIMNNINVVEKWRIGSVRRLVEQNKVETAPNQDREENIEWINLYNDGHLKEALAAINKKLATNPDRFVLAKLHNDRGYIESGLKPKMLEVAEHDLNTAMDLHFFDLAITLLNLSYIDLENDHFEAAITKIEEALMITLSKFEIEVGYLRFKLPGNHLGFKVDWEQHPANILETAYINMSYALLQIKGYQDALNALQEALSILPNSIRLKHSLARLYLHQMRANLADPIYNELSYIKLLDPGIKTEIARLSRALALYRRKRKA